jgi:hypothetical protein
LKQGIERTRRVTAPKHDVAAGCMYDEVGSLEGLEQHAKFIAHS